MLENAAFVFAHDLDILRASPNNHIAVVPKSCVQLHQEIILKLTYILKHGVGQSFFFYHVVCLQAKKVVVIQGVLLMYFWIKNQITWSSLSTQVLCDLNILLFLISFLSFKSPVLFFYRVTTADVTAQVWIPTVLTLITLQCKVTQRSRLTYGRCLIYIGLSSGKNFD